MAGPATVESSVTTVPLVEMTT
jgi:hypothetical protein